MIYPQIAGPVRLPKANRQAVGDFNIDSHQHSSHLIVGVIRWLSGSTFDFKSYTGHSINPQAAENDALSQATQAEIFFIEKFLTSGSVSSTKSAYIHSMELELTDPDNELMRVLIPDDWIFCCVVNDNETAQKIRKAAQTGQPINRKDWGLKFIGKIDAVSKSVYRKMDGSKGRDIHLTACAFKELASKLYYDPYYKQASDVNNLKFLEKTASSADAIQIAKSADVFYIDTYIPFIFTTFLGRGPGATELNKVQQGEAPKSFNTSFVIPAKVGRLMGTPHNGFSYIYTDLVKYLGGVQKYDSDAYLPKLKDNSDSENFITHTTDPLEGIRDSGYLNPFTNEPVWGICSSSLNTPINEMYTSLRLGLDGNIQPFIIARQVPFATPFITTLFGSELAITGYYEIPRWVVPSTLVTNLVVGRSTSMRSNYVEVLAVTGHSEATDNAQVTNQKAVFPASVDFINIKTNGLLTFTQKTMIASIDIKDTAQAAFRWTRLMSDRIMSGHLRYSGSIITKGIYEPICVGDNLEFGNTLYHIETLTHRFVKGGDGLVTFGTEMNVSNGLNIPTNGFLNKVEDLWPDFEDVDVQDGGPEGNTDGE